MSIHTSKLSVNDESFTNRQANIQQVQQVSNNANTHASCIEGDSSAIRTSNYRSFSSVTNEYHKFSKLNLPNFRGDILGWRSYWDSYKSAVRLNTTLNNVQRFNYLKSILYDEGRKTITGFTLTNSNYGRVLSLLQQRYDQDHKIVQKYMKELIYIPSAKTPSQVYRLSTTMLKLM